MPRLVDKRMILLMCSQIVVVSIGIFYLKFNINNLKINESRFMNKNINKKIGAKLKTIGLNQEAISILQDSLKNLDLTTSSIEASNISFLIAELFEKEGLYKKAITYFLLVESYNPKSNNIAISKKKVVSLLEKLKKYSSSKMMLSESVSLNKSEPKKGDDIVAVVGNENVYLGDLNNKLDELPEQLRKKFAGLNGKKAYLKKMVTDKLLTQSALRAGFNLNSKFIRTLEKLKSQLLIQYILEKEINTKSIDRIDLINFYKANSNNKRFKINGKLQKLEKILPKVRMAYINEKAQEKYQLLVQKLLKNENVKLFLKKVK